MTDRFKEAKDRLMSMYFNPNMNVSDYDARNYIVTIATESEQLRKELDAVTTKLDTVTSERDDLADIIKGMPRYAEELRKTDGYLSGGMKINLCHDIDKLAKKVNENA